MLTGLYNKIREQNDFDDIFKPVSKEELLKRRKEKLERSDYKYAYAGNVKGTVVHTGPDRVTAIGLERRLVAGMYLIFDEIDLNIDIPRDSLVYRFHQGYTYCYTIEGRFLGTFSFFSREKLDETDIARMMETTLENFNDPWFGSSMGRLSIKDVNITDLEVISRGRR